MTRARESLLILAIAALGFICIWIELAVASGGFGQ
jgi:hypothetical protein